MEWDSTQNLMIEGDNLEVLKLLQRSYSRNVKLTYIDPPFNTGNEFVYPDNFQDNIKNYLELTGHVDVICFGVCLVFFMPFLLDRASSNSNIETGSI